MRIEPRWIKVIALAALMPVLARCAAECINSACSTGLPYVNDKVLTFCFTVFALSHATLVLGWRRAVSFLVVTIVVSWSFEAVGVATGSVYGNYRYGDLLGRKLAGVPVLIPFAWFMMIYPSWFISHVVLDGAESPNSLRGISIRAVVAAITMTAWDAVMDPGKAAQGNWTWLDGGRYFGVPVQNFVGWFVTTCTIYLVSGAVFRRVSTGTRPDIGRSFLMLPAVAYFSVAVARVFISSPFPLRVSAAFSMVFISVVALLRLTFGAHQTILPAAQPRYLPES